MAEDTLNIHPLWAFRKVSMDLKAAAGTTYDIALNPSGSQGQFLTICAIFQSNTITTVTIHPTVLIEDNVIPTTIIASTTLTGLGSDKYIILFPTNPGSSLALNAIARVRVVTPASAASYTAKCLLVGITSPDGAT